MHSIKELSGNDMNIIKNFFKSVFMAPPWNDDWSDDEQLSCYIADLTENPNSLTYGFYEDGEIIGLSMGSIKHWYTGTEYCIDEFCIKSDMQGKGLGTLFLCEITSAIKEMGLVSIFLQTERTAPAYKFYVKNGFTEMHDHVSFYKSL